MNCSATAPITIQDFVAAVLGERDQYSGADYQSCGVAMLGGCAGCHATIAGYNAYPSKKGVWMCGDCIGDGGWATVREFAADTFDSSAPAAVLHWMNTSTVDMTADVVDAELEGWLSMGPHDPNGSTHAMDCECGQHFGLRPALPANGHMTDRSAEYAAERLRARFGSDRPITGVE